MRHNASEDTDHNWALWAGTMGYESSVDERLAAALANGFGRISISPLDVAAADAGGTPAKELGHKIRDAGLEIELEGFMTWYPGEPVAEIPLAAFTSTDVLGMTEALQAVSLTVLARPTCDLPVNEVATCFAEICDRTADLGTMVQLEFMPFMAITDLASALAIIETADRPNGGLLFDTWHFFRGNPDFATLESLSGNRIFGVQVSDGGTTMAGSLIEDTFQRQLPGDGCFDLVRVLRTLDRIGALGLVGPEVISPTTAAMSPVDAAQICRERTQSLITEAHR